MNYKTLLVIIAAFCSLSNLFPAVQTPLEKRAEQILAYKNSPEFEQLITPLIQELEKLKKEQQQEDEIEFAEEKARLERAKAAAVVAKNETEADRLSQELATITIRSNTFDTVDVDKSIQFNVKMALALYAQEQQCAQTKTPFNEKEAIKKLLELNKECCDYEDAREANIAKENEATLKRLSKKGPSLSEKELKEKIKADVAKAQRARENRLALARQLAKEKKEKKREEKEATESQFKLKLSQSMTEAEINTLLMRATSEASKKRFGKYIAPTQEDIDAAKKRADDLKEEYKEPKQKTADQRDAFVERLKFEDRMAFLLMEQEQAFKRANPPLTPEEERQGKIRKSCDLRATLLPILDAHKEFYEEEQEEREIQSAGKRNLTTLRDAQKERNKRMDVLKMNKNNLKREARKQAKIQKRKDKKIAALAAQPENKELFARYEKLSKAEQEAARETLTYKQKRVLDQLEADSKTIYYNKEDKDLDEAGWEPWQLPKPREPKKERVYENFFLETIKHPLENRRKALAFAGVPAIIGLFAYNYKQYVSKCTQAGGTPMPAHKYALKLLKSKNRVSIAAYAFLILQGGLVIKDSLYKAPAEG